IAHLAEDVRPFVAVGQELGRLGLSAPEIRATDLERGFLMVEDLGDRVYGALVVAGEPMLPLWRAATDVLVALRRHPLAERLPLPGGDVHHVPAYDAGALQIEIELLTDWYVPAATGRPLDERARADFLAHWQPLLALMARSDRHWVLRDFHSPNLIDLPGREGLGRVGIIDFQDAMRGHPAYDLVSLTQDARLDVPAEIEAELMNHYCAGARAADPAFDEAELRAAHAILGAQRSTKIIGIFARLARRDGKRGYLRHIPRLWTYLERNLAHPQLAALAAWYDSALPQELRMRPLAP
ncbi:MAG: phosphotransferase, partial [Hyphomicrobiaceae bacterium]